MTDTTLEPVGGAVQEQEEVRQFTEDLNPFGDDWQEGDLSTQDAEKLCDKINRAVGTVMNDVVKFVEGRGWLALGYSTMEECSRIRFRQSARALQYMVEAAKTRLMIESAPIEEEERKTFRSLSNVAVRAIKGVEPEKIGEVLTRAKEKAAAREYKDPKARKFNNGRVTATIIEEARREVAPVFKQGTLEPEEKSKTKRARKGKPEPGAEEGQLLTFTRCELDPSGNTLFVFFTMPDGSEGETWVPVEKLPKIKGKT